jgi:hypothetical protein
MRTFARVFTRKTVSYVHSAPASTIDRPHPGCTCCTARDCCCGTQRGYQGMEDTSGSIASVLREEDRPWVRYAHVMKFSRHAVRVDSLMKNVRATKYLEHKHTIGPRCHCWTISPPSPTVPDRSPFLKIGPITVLGVLWARGKRGGRKLDVLDEHAPTIQNTPQPFLDSHPCNPLTSRCRFVSSNPGAVAAKSRGFRPGADSTFRPGGAST